MRDPLCQILPLDEFLHGGHKPRRSPRDRGCAQFWAISRSERPHPACESRQAIGVAGESVQAGLQRDVPISFVSRARQTYPMPPSPIRAVIS